MALILCLETATTNCSVALSLDGKPVIVKEENRKTYSHSENLHVFIEEVLEEGGFSFSDLEGVAVSKGPGSYTGLRIGVSSAKGIAFALDIPLLSIPTLEILASQVKEESEFIIPLLDARRMEVYSSVFDAGRKEIRETRAEILTEDSFELYLKQGKTIFLGDGSEKFQAICEHPNAAFYPDRFPSAREMAQLAEIKMKNEDFEDVAYFEPYYLKDFLPG